MAADPVDPILERYRNAYLKLRRVVHDPATDLPAYPVLIDALRTLLDRRRRLGVVHLEADNLGVLESLYGWQVFDRVVARAAEALRAATARAIPAGALLAAGAVPADRFVVFIPDGTGGAEIDERWLAAVAETLRRAVDDAMATGPLADLAPRPVFRAGHAILSENPFFRFERRVHGAVASARALDERRFERRERAKGAELRRIIREGDITTLFQPVVNLATRTVIGYEALSRGPRNTPLEMPRALFDCSGRLGATGELDRVCRATALRRSPASATHGKLFVNVHASGLEDPERLREGILDTLTDAPREPRDVVFEFSERAVESGLPALEAAARVLRTEGFGIAMDDVGNGAAGVESLERLRPDWLKIDPGLIRGIHGSLIKQEILGTLVRQSERIAASVVAVGVETEDEAAVAVRAGVPFAQGFLFAVPAARDAIEVAAAAMRDP